MDRERMFVRKYVNVGNYTFALWIRIGLYDGGGNAEISVQSEKTGCRHKFFLQFIFSLLDSNVVAKAMRP